MWQEMELNQGCCVTFSAARLGAQSFARLNRWAEVGMPEAPGGEVAEVGG